MSRYNTLLWLVGLIATLVGAALLVFNLTGCSKPPPPLSPAELAIVAAAAECEKVIHREIASRDTCPEAELAIRASRACAISFPAGISLDCKEHRP